MRCSLIETPTLLSSLSLKCKGSTIRAKRAGAPPAGSPPRQPGTPLGALAPLAARRHLRHLLHHALRLRELLEQAVHVGDRRAAALRDALAAAGRDDLRL